jgi:hypothetical protein
MPSRKYQSLNAIRGVAVAALAFAALGTLFYKRAKETDYQPVSTSLTNQDSKILGGNVFLGTGGDVPFTASANLGKATCSSAQGMTGSIDIAANFNGTTIYQHALTFVSQRSSSGWSIRATDAADTLWNALRPTELWMKPEQVEKLIVSLADKCNGTGNPYAYEPILTGYLGAIHDANADRITRWTEERKAISDQFATARNDVKKDAGGDRGAMVPVFVPAIEPTMFMRGLVP